MSKVLVTLTPVGKYFFGGEMRFATGDKKHDKQFVSYIVRSELMPQQTSLLGMLRFLLLSNEDELFDEKANCIRSGMKEKVKAVIGEHGFQVKERLPEPGNAGEVKPEGMNPAKSTGNDYGWIQSIGPCFLYHKKSGRAFFRSVINEGMELDFGSSVEGYINGKKRVMPSIRVKKKLKEKEEWKWELYTGKDTLERIWIAADGTFEKESDLFKEDERIGIDKSVDGKKNDSAFYKQISYRLDGEYCLALIAEIDLGERRAWEDYDGFCKSG